MTGSKTTNRNVYFIDSQSNYSYFKRWLEEWCHLTIASAEWYDDYVDATMYDFKNNLYTRKKIKYGKTYTPVEEGNIHFTEVIKFNFPKQKLMDVE